MSDVRRRRLVGAGLLVLFVLGLGVFLAPFAFPTPPPIVTRFQATRLFSPNGDGAREVAKIAVRLNEPSLVDVEIRDNADKRWKGVINEARPKEIVRLEWDGTDDRGAPVPDGRYVVRLRARSQVGAKKWNKSRAIVVDRAAPPLGTLTVASAVLAGPGDGQCRIAATALDKGTMTIQAFAQDGKLPDGRFGPTNVAAGETSLWNWNGLRADGTPAPAGLYTIRASLSDPPGNRSERTETCWVGGAIGTLVPGRPALGTRVAVRLRTPAGAPVPPSTRVTLEVFRRIGDPGTASQVLGRQVGARVSGPLGTVRLPLPRRIPAVKLWVVASYDGGRVLIPLRP